MIFLKNPKNHDIYFTIGFLHHFDSVQNHLYIKEDACLFCLTLIML